MLIEATVNMLTLHTSCVPECHNESFAPNRLVTLPQPIHAPLGQIYDIPNAEVLLFSELTEGLHNLIQAPLNLYPSVNLDDSMTTIYVNIFIFCMVSTPCTYLHPKAPLSTCLHHLHKTGQKGFNSQTL